MVWHGKRKSQLPFGVLPSSWGMPDLPMTSATSLSPASVGTADQFFQVNGMIFYQLRRLRRQLIGKLSKITRPTLIIHLRDDDQSSITNALYLQTRLSGPMEVLILDDSYHVVTLDKQRQIVAERVSSFAARLNVGQQLSPQYSASVQ